MARCQGIKRDGGRCTASVQPDSSYCWNHDPRHAEKRKSTASKAGRSRPSPEIARIKKLLSELTSDVLEGRLETSRAAIANQLLNTYLRALEIERKIKETEDHAERLEILEAITQEKGPRQWQRKR
jgi:hypothetical protein